MTLNDQDLERYARHIVLKEIGGQGQQQLLNSKVLVIGAGGLGSPLLMYLAAAGVGTIGIVDDDEVTLSNLQRQILYTTGAVGMAKTDSAGKTLEALNPGVKVIPHAVRLTPENADAIIKHYDLVATAAIILKPVWRLVTPAPRLESRLFQPQSCVLTASCQPSNPMPKMRMESPCPVTDVWCPRPRPQRD